ncbi:Uncharacterized protein HZ326_30741 [Fusarium oxysporum f. sp. albedinis]|nr:Uncharacterized protein HZ326_30741 [Fusarium oxysporum f. sp. albedinis]
MVAVIPLVASDEAGNHSPPATDLPLGLIVFAIYILALTCYVMCVSRRRNISGSSGLGRAAVRSIKSDGDANLN